MRISFWGDISFGAGLQSVTEHDGAGFFFENITNLLRDLDVNVVNFDCAITDSDATNPFAAGSWMKTGFDSAEAMRKAGIHVACLANNHIWDYRVEGIRDTLAAFREAGIVTVGVGTDLQTALQPVVVEKPDVKVGIIACTNLVGNTAYSDEFVVAPLRRKLIKRAIGQHRSSVDHTLITVHWGSEFVNYPAADQVRLAREFIDQGATAVIGHHPHVVQGVEAYKGGMIAYSLGDLIIDQSNKPEGPGSNYSMGLSLVLDKNRVVEWEVVPLMIDSTFRPFAPDDDNKREILSYINEFSRCLENPDQLVQAAFRQTSDKLMGSQWRSFKKAYNRAGISGILRKLQRVRWRHFKLLHYLISRWIGGG